MTWILLYPGYVCKFEQPRGESLFLTGANPPRDENSDRLALKPVGQGPGSVLTELGFETAFATQTRELARSRPRHHEPVSGDLVALQGAGVLQQEAAGAPSECSNHTLDPTERRRAIRPRCLEETHRSRAGNVAAEFFLDVDLNQRRCARVLVVDCGLIRFDLDRAARALVQSCP
jgi:hypothetical protein